MVNNSGVLAVVNEAALHLGADGVAPVANKYYRLRQSNIAKSLDGSSDGVFADLHYSNTPADIEDVTTKIWGIHSQVIEAGGGAGGGGTTVTFFQVEDDGTTGQLTTGTLADLAGMWASPSLTDGDFSWNGTTGVLTVNTDGILELDVSVTGHYVTVSYHVQIDMSIQIDTGGGYSELIGAHNYAARDFTHDMGTTSVVGFKVIVSAGDLIKVQLKDIGQVFSIGVAAVAAQTYLSAKLYT